MATLTQLIKKSRKKKIYKWKRKALDKCPQKKGFCTRVFKLTPRKPNSALRSCIRVFFISTQDRLTAYIPGGDPRLQKHANVLIRGGRTKDLPGLKYKAIRGKLDLRHVANRKTSRSKYGMKILPGPKIIKLSIQEYLQQQMAN